MQARHDGEECDKEDEQEGIGLSARVEQCLSLMHENALMSQQVQVADTGKAVFMMSQCVWRATKRSPGVGCLYLTDNAWGSIKPRAMQSRDIGRVSFHHMNRGVLSKKAHVDDLMTQTTRPEPDPDLKSV